MKSLLRTIITMMVLGLFMMGNLIASPISAQIAHHFSSEESLMNFHQAIVQLVLEIEENQKFPTGKIIEGLTQKDIEWIKVFKLLMNEAYAEENQICFFGGWPSLKIGGYCRSPWKYDDHALLKDFDPHYDRNHYCGGANLFRCNPLLFGPGDGGGGNSLSPEYDSDKGMCIRFAKISEVSRLCFEEYKKRNNARAIVLQILLRKDFKDRYVKIVEAVKEFCTKNSSYDACSILIGSAIAHENILCELGLDPEKKLGIESFYSLKNKFSDIENFILVNRKKKQIDKPKEEEIPKPIKVEVTESLKKTDGLVKFELSQGSENKGYFRKDDLGSNAGNGYYATEGIIQRIELIGKKLAEQDMVMVITEISDEGGPTIGHQGHQEGKHLDLRFMNSEGKACNVNVNPDCYDQEKTFEMLKIFVDIDPYRIKKILISDLDLIKKLNDYAQINYPNLKSQNIAILYKPTNKHIHIEYW